MTRQEIVSLTLKLFGLFVLVSVIKIVPSFLFIWPGVGMFIGMLLTAVALAVFGLALIRYSDPISQRCYPDVDPRENVFSMNPGHLTTILYGAIGLYLFAELIAPLLSQIAYLIYLGSSGSYGGDWSKSRIVTGLITPILQMIVGLVLFLRADGLARLWWGMRSWTRAPHAGGETHE